MYLSGKDPIESKKQEEAKPGSWLDDGCLMGPCSCHIYGQWRLLLAQPAEASYGCLRGNSGQVSPPNDVVASASSPSSSVVFVKVAWNNLTSLGRWIRMKPSSLYCLTWKSGHDLSNLCKVSCFYHCGHAAVYLLYKWHHGHVVWAKLPNGFSLLT